MNKKTCKISGSLVGPQAEIDRLVITGANDLVIDFTDCNFISVPGLEWLKDMLSKAGIAGINVSFVSIPPVLYKVFKVARIENILNACGSPAASSSNVC
jgi:anti-anti-sigma regulatory factor